MHGSIEDAYIGLVWAAVPRKIRPWDCHSADSRGRSSAIQSSPSKGVEGVHGLCRDCRVYMGLYRVYIALVKGSNGWSAILLPKNGEPLPNAKEHENEMETGVLQRCIGVCNVDIKIHA